MTSLPFWTLSSLLVLSACGGSAKPADEVRPPVEDSRPDDAVDSEEPEAPSGPDCSDGTCFACGAGICPKGSYCDAGATGGGACAWIAECPGEPSCGCLTKTLGSSCSCDATKGGPLVRCP